MDIGIHIADCCALLGKTDECHLVTFMNASAWAVAKKRPDYAAQLEKMTSVIPASRDVACAVSKLTGNDTCAICFETHSLVTPFFKTAIEQKNTLMLVGGQPAIDERVHDKLLIRYPGLNIVSTINGYGDFAPKIALVIDKNPDCVLVDLNSPRSNAFLLALKDAGYKGLAIACDGFFDEALRDDDFYPEWVKRWNLFYAARLLSEPKTLLSQFIRDYPAFAFPAVKALVNKLATHFSA